MKKNPQTDSGKETDVYTWTYRIMRHKEKNGEVWYGLHEVHYIDKKLWGWTEDSMIGAFETPEEMILSLKTMIKDAQLSSDDILNYNELKPEVELPDEGGENGKIHRDDDSSKE